MVQVGVVRFGSIGERWRFARGHPGNAAPLGQRRLARRVLLQLRFAVQSNDAGALDVVQRLVALAFSSELGAAPRLEPSPVSSDQASHLLSQLEHLLDSGSIVVALEEQPKLRELEEPPLPPLPPLPPARESTDTFYEVRLVDEIGQAVSGIEVELDLGGQREVVATNPAGVAFVDGVTSMSAVATVTDVASVEKAVEPRWTKPRSGKAPTGVNTQSFELTGASIQAVPVKPAVPNTIVLTPPLGKLHAELWDKSGRTRHVQASYTISGNQSFSGKTDDEGRLLHDLVFPGDYRLSLTVEDKTFECSLVVLDRAAEPQVRRVGAVRTVKLARLLGMLFETDKNFLLPSALPGLREIRRIYEASSPAKLLIVGHTDTTADPRHNDELSVERADAVAAYLQDRAEVWLTRYEPSVPESKRWGLREDLLMITSLPDFATKPPLEDAVRWFQRTRNLKMDGISGPKTRTELVREYMALDGVSLANEPDFEIEITTHGCGENFPLDESGENIDAGAADETESAPNRRVELFFFDAEFGIDPPPPGKNSPPGSAAYPEWRRRALETVDFDTADGDEATCHFSFVLQDESTGQPRQFAVVRFEIVPRVPVTVQTDHTGLFQFGDVVPGDYALDVDGIQLTVSALPKSETQVPLLVRPDPILV